MDKQEIAIQLRNQCDLLIDWYRKDSIRRSDKVNGELWTAGQHLYHLLKITKPLAVGMGMPNILLKLKFGSIRRPTVSYEALKQKYQDSLTKGAKASGPYIPRDVKEGEIETLLNRFEKAGSDLIKVLNQWSEKKLDKQKVLHPILEGLSLREMLYFTIFHIEHHRKILESRYEQ
ncbi:MAG: DinB family protein [Bacteroidota bacterium]